MRRIIVLMALGILLGGCASMSKIEKVSESESHFKDAVYKGHDFYISDEKVDGEKYRVFHQASTGLSGTGGIRRSATQRADEYCKNLAPNKRMLTVSEHTAAPPYILGNFPQIEIIFACVDKKENKAMGNSVADKHDRISKIKKLLESGALTQEEFDEEKENILSEQ